MANSWTSSQLEAIEAKEHAVVVSAAAGSGKTAVLIEKLLRILSDRENPVPADRIAVVTFTNDAASQMKQRLADALAAAAENDPDNDWLIMQQSLVQGAKISTISSFCFNLIKENISLTDIDPAFRIAEPAEEDIIVGKAIENTVERRLEAEADQNGDVHVLTDFFSPGAKNINSLSNLLQLLRRNILALPFGERFMEKCVKAYADPPDTDSDPMIKLYLSGAAEKLKTALFISERCCENIVKAYAPISGADKKTDEKIAKTADIFNSDRQLIAKLIQLTASPSEYFGGKTELKFDRLTFYDPYKKDLDPTEHTPVFAALSDRCKADRDKYKKIVSEAASTFTLAQIADDYAVHADICKRLFSLLTDVLAEEKKLKSEKNVLGFSDAEQTAVSLLCRCNEDGSITKTPLAKELSDYFAIVMIDEFQDSNAIQELIFRMISHGGSPERAGDNFFAVGDIKQSIYRFRNADPRIFRRNLVQSVPYSEAKEGESAYVLLNKNFRSSEGVVSFVNAVFGAIMSAENGGIDYGSDDMLVKGSDITFDKPTELIMIPPAEAELSEEDMALSENDDGEENEDSADSRVTADDVLEAKAAANRIKRLLAEETIPDKGGMRKCLPSDICILMRNTAKIPLFIKYLEKAGIPAGGDAVESYLASREISVLINLLRAADNPTLDIPLTAVLMSPMFMFTAEDMARLRVLDYTSVYADLSAAAEGGEDIPEGFAAKCRDFLKIFGEIRQFAASNSTEKLIRYIYDRTDFLAAVSVYKDSARKKANLRLLPVYAADYDKSGSGGLSGFVRKINAMTEKGKDFSAASAISEDGGGKVAIKTIHKSKGLEYPFVFLCQMHTHFNKTDLSNSFMFSSDCGAAFSITDSARAAAYTSFPREAVKAEKEKALRDEEMMLFYVALTRAKLQLFITRQQSKRALSDRQLAASLCTCGGGKQDIAVSSGSSMDMWLEAALSGFEEADGTLTQDSCKVIITNGEAAAVGSDAENEEDTPSEDRTKEIEQFCAEYRKKQQTDYDPILSKTAAKLTVSEIAKKNMSPADRIYVLGKRDTVKARRYPAGMSAAEAGTAVHAFMQNADLLHIAAAPEDRRSDAVTEEALRLADKTLLTDMQAKCADPDLILPFFETELFARLKKSSNVLKEKKFLVKISDLSLDDSDLLVYNGTEGMLQGVADCLFEEEDGWVLIDYKTDRGSSPQQLTEKYSRQLKLYAKALSLILEKPVKEAFLYSFAMGVSVKTDIL